jgi:hypothetical protein
MIGTHIQIPSFDFHLHILHLPRQTLDLLQNLINSLLSAQIQGATTIPLRLRLTELLLDFTLSS